MTKTRSNAAGNPPASLPPNSKHPRARDTSKNVESTKNASKIDTIAGKTWQTIADPTDHWHTLLEAMPEASTPSPFTTKDIFGEGETLHEMAKAVKTFVTPKRNTPVSSKDWETVFVRCFDEEKLFDNPHAEKLRNLAIKLAWTDPTSAFDNGRWHNQELIAATDTNAWHAAYNLFGSPWKNRNDWFPVKKTNQITAFFEKAKTSNPANSNSTHTKDNKTNDPKTKTNQPLLESKEKPHGKKFTDNNDEKQPPSKNTNPTNDAQPKHQYKNNQATNPPADKNDKSNGNVQFSSKVQLHEPQMTQTMPGITTTNPYKSNKAKNLGSKLSELAKKPASNTQPTQSTPHPLNPIFISRPKRTPNTKEATFKTDKKYESFFKIRLPKIQSNTPGPQEEEVTKSFQTVFSKMQSTDPSIVLYTWNRGTRLSSLKKGQQLPKTREDLEEYVDKVWLQKGRSPWIRFKIGHNKPTDNILTEPLTTWAKREDYTIMKEKIQSKTLSKVGFLMGYHPAAINASNLELALQQFPKLQKIQLEIRIEAIQVSKSKPRSKARAPTIWTSWENAGKCRLALAQIYSSKNNGNYPLATQARFIPNPLDSRFITTVQARQMAAKAQSKHENFVNKTSTAIGYTIIGLDYYIEDYEVTLRQAIMSIRSTTEPEYNLFTAVDDMSYSNKVVFAFRKSFEAEAAAAIPGLPLILQGYYGLKVWTWFTEEAKAETEAYEWDPNQGLIEKPSEIDIDEDYINLDGWEDLDDDDQIATTSKPTTVHGFELAPTLGKNQYQDDGTIKTKHFALESDNNSTQESSTTPTSNNSSPPNLQSLLALLKDPQMAQQVRTALSQTVAQQPTSEDAHPALSPTEARQPTSENAHPTVTPTKTTPPDTNTTNQTADADDMEIDQE